MPIEYHEKFRGAFTGNVIYRRDLEGLLPHLENLIHEKDLKGFSFQRRTSEGVVSIWVSQQLPLLRNTYARPWKDLLSVEGMQKIFRQKKIFKGLLVYIRTIKNLLSTETLKNARQKALEAFWSIQVLQKFRCICIHKAFIELKVFCLLLQKMFGDQPLADTGSYVNKKNLDTFRWSVLFGSLRYEHLKKGTATYNGSG